MFKQLSPLLATRSLVLTVASVADDRIRVTVTPRSAGKDDPKELSQPFAVEGTAEELDADLPQAISGYTAEVMTLTRSLALVKANMEAALKEAKAEADKKTAEARKGNKTSAPAKVEPIKPEVKKVEPPSLFNTPGKTASPEIKAPQTSASATAEETNGDDQEEEEDGEEDSSTPIAIHHPQAAQRAITAQTSASQPTMFPTPNDEEDEILKEAFYGADDNLIAA